MSNQTNLSDTANTPCPFTPEQIQWLKDNLSIWTVEMSRGEFRISIQLCGVLVDSDYINVSNLYYSGNE